MILYVLQAGENCKIGISSNFKKRLATYATHNPKFSIVKIFECDAAVAKEVELAIKRLNSGYRAGTSREWFSVSPAVILDQIHVEFSKLNAAATQPGLHGVPVPRTYAELLKNISEAVRSDISSTEQIWGLKEKAASMFGKSFSLGLATHELDIEKVLLTDSAGLDHKNCKPGGSAFIAENRWVHFPHQDHTWEYYDLLPVSGDYFVASCRAVVSMPYLSSDKTGIRGLAESRAYADRLGWNCTIHNEWSWHWPKDTGLILYQRKESPKDLAKAWDTSFKKWVFSNRKNLLLTDADEWMSYAIEDVTTDTHFPLGVQNYPECLEGYLKHQSPALEFSPEGTTAHALNKLFRLWNSSRGLEH